MISTFNLFLFPRNPILPLLISLPARNFETTSNKSILCFQKPSKQLRIFCLQHQAMPPSKGVKILAEYAKSNRSSCKKCSQVIQAKALRLGLVSRDPRGFDMTKWHHLDCFSEKIESTGEILGFDSLKVSDLAIILSIACFLIGNTIIACSRATFKLGTTHFEGTGDADLFSAGKKHVAMICYKRKEIGVSCAFKMCCSEFNSTSGRKQKSCKRTGNYSSLEEDDQEALKKMMSRVNDAVEECPNSASKKADESGEELLLEGMLSKKRKKPDGNGEKLEQEKTSKSMNEDELDELEETSSTKKVGLSIPTKEVQAQLEIPFSLTDLKDDYKGAKLLPKWKAFQTIIFLEREDGLHDSGKIAAFDFDGCLAKTHVQRVGAQFWSLMYPSIPDKLQSLYNDGYKLVIFTNESNIDRWKNKRQVAVDSKLGRLNNFIKHVKVPIQVFVACGYSSGKVEDLFRKPKPGMWQIMEKHFNSGIPIDMDQSFYVGDAAGRINDHSDADLEFAKAIGLKFIVPEDYFGA